MYRVYISHLGSATKSYTGKEFRTYREAQDYADQLNRSLKGAVAVVSSF